MIVAVAVMAEECRDTGDCQHVTCPENDYVLECHNRQCTCTHSKIRLLLEIGKQTGC